jgi:hypothetical protein
VSAVEKGKREGMRRGGREESGESCGGTVGWLMFSLARFISQVRILAHREAARDVNAGQKYKEDGGKGGRRLF